MRKAIYAGTHAEGRALLERARAIHLATTGDEGQPILRTLHAVLDGDALFFHGAPAGEKIEALGRGAVVAAEETIASIPSWFTDPEKACPATTYYVSAQAHGVIEEVTDPAEKARSLQLLMEKYQPEGGHVPITGDDPLYAKAVRGLLVGRVRIERLDTKTKLGQNRRPEERTKILEHLWRRGGPGDVEAIVFLMRRFPDIPRPAFLPDGLHISLGPADTEDVIRLLEHAYWLHSIPEPAIRRALARSSALVGARAEDGSLIGFARAVCDGKVAWIYDVVVAPPARNAGLGAKLMALLLDHPAVRDAIHVRLTTRDAKRFYGRLGFVDLVDAPRHPWPSVEMIRTSR